ncbi:MAG: RnfABCDGE type electron transport complex subunit D [Acidobacteria bacterium]|nr:MAG: RnfABCDGE type electron transport complex subunit D [Acidobacteriota bacterium]
MTASPQLELTTAPFLHRGLSTRRVMFEVLASLVPVVAAAIYFFGLAAVLLVLAATAGAVLVEWAFDAQGTRALRDGSALLTGVLLALTLPPSLPMWMAFLGGAIGIGLGKTIWGGLGHNLFNPALVGRAFLQAAFPTAMTTWARPGLSFAEIRPATLAWPFMKPAADVVTTATPLGLAKFDHQYTGLWPLLAGTTAGSLGETAGLVLIACGLWLAIRRVFDWRLPVSTLLSVAFFSALLRAFGGEAYPGPAFMLCSGGLLLGAVYMVTDPVTTPLTPRGAWIFGAGCGLLVVLIRVFGGLPEGVMYAILLMNAVTPLINRYTQPRVFGGEGR